MIKIQLVTKPLSEVKNDYLVFPIFEGEKINLRDKTIEDFFKDNPKFGKLFESQILYLNKIKVLLLGIGKKDKLDFSTFQNWVGAATKTLAKKTKQASIILPRIDDLSAEEIGQALAIGSEIALYDPSKNFKSDYEIPKMNSLEVIVERAERGYLEGIKKGGILAEAINEARELSDMPPNIMTPTYFLNVVKRLAKENKLRLTILTEAQAAKKGMGAFAGVAQGSDEPSYMIALEYKGDIKSKEKLAIVGKGITYDSGGLSLKPSDHMADMKYDMVGAANALASIVITAKLGLKTNIIAIMAVTENLPGGKAQRPGDIVKTYSGKTVEVINTDAEGRLVLIDAIAYANQDFAATNFIDLASLTGAIIVTLGDNISGVFSNNEEFTKQLINTGKEVGERFWQLPMDEDYEDMVKGTMSDLENSGHGGSLGWRTAGSITGAKIIQLGSNIGNKPWIHLDIAGTAWDTKPRPYRAPSATGVAIKTLVKLIEG